jgi:excinuclease ABC subunit A
MRVGEPRCPDHDVPLAAQTVSQMVDNVLSQPEGKRLMLLAPIIKERKGEHQNAGKPGKPGLYPRPYRRRSVRPVRSAKAGAAEEAHH